MNVVCLQTGKSMIVSLKQLSTEEGKPIEDVRDGTLAMFETKDGRTYDVKIRMSE